MIWVCWCDVVNSPSHVRPEKQAYMYKPSINYKEREVMLIAVLARTHFCNTFDYLISALRILWHDSPCAMVLHIASFTRYPCLSVAMPLVDTWSNSLAACNLSCVNECLSSNPSLCWMWAVGWEVWCGMSLPCILTTLCVE
jgi:hypothetical protein